MTYNLKKIAATASVVALMCGAAGTASAQSFTNVTPTDKSPATELDIAATPFVNSYSFDISAASGQVLPDGNVKLTFTAPSNMVFDTVPSAANLSGAAVVLVTHTAGSGTVVYDLQIATGVSSISISGFDLSISDCGGSAADMTFSMTDDASSPTTITGTYPGTGEPPLVAPCEQALDVVVTDDVATDDTIVLNDGLTLSPSNQIGWINTVINRDAILDANMAPMRWTCVDAVSFDVNVPNSGISDVTVGIQLGVTEPLVAGVASFTLTDAGNIQDFMNEVPDEIWVETDGTPISTFVGGTSVTNVVVTFNDSCADLIPSASYAGGALDSIDAVGVQAFGPFDWVGQGGATTSFFRVTRLNGPTPFEVELVNSDADGIYSGTLTPDADGRIVINSNSFGLGAAAPTYTNGDVLFRFETNEPLDVDRLLLTTGFGITNYGDLGNFGTDFVDGDAANSGYGPASDADNFNGTE